MSITGELERQPGPIEAIDRPFAANIMARAKVFADQYRVVMWIEDGGYYGFGVELPGAGGDGPTPDACMAAARESFVVAVASALEMGEEPPQPLTLLEQMADEQMADEA